jgi:hypothetical protein
VGRQLGGRAGLADPGVSGEQDERALTLGRLAPAALEERQLDAATDERVPIHRGAQRCGPGGRLPGDAGDRRDGCGRAMHGGRLTVQDALEDGHRRGAGRGPELLAQQQAQLLEGPQRLRRVARGLVDLHQQPVRGLAEGRGGDRGARGLLGRAELAPALAQAGLGERLERAQPDRLQLAALLGRPAAVGVGQERLQVAGERRPRPVGGERVIAGLHRRLGFQDRGGRRLDVDAHVVDVQPQLAAPGEDAVAQRAPELGQQRAQRGVGGGRRPFGPEDVDQLVARAAAIAVEREVREEQTALPPWKSGIQTPPPDVDHYRAAQPDIPALAHLRAGRYRLAKVSPRFRQRKKRIMLSAAHGTDLPDSR